MSIATTPVEKTSEENPASSIPEVFGASPWRKSAASDLRKATAFTPDSAAWKALRKQLSRRAKLVLLWRDEKHSPVLWGMESLLSAATESVASESVAEESYEESAGLIARIHDFTSAPRVARGQPKKKSRSAGRKAGVSEFDAERALATWLADGECGPASPRFVAESLAWGYAVCPLAEVTSPELWWELLARLTATALEAQSQSPQGAAVPYQLLAGELAIVLGATVPELRRCREFAKSGAAATAEAIEQLLDGEGIPHRDHLAGFRAVAASWLRCRELTNQKNGAVASRPMQKAYAQLDDVIRAVGRLTRSDGSPHFAASQAVPEGIAWLKDLAAAADDKDAGRELRKALGESEGGKKAKSDVGALSAAGVNAEWSELAVLRTNWDRRSPRMVVDYGRSPLRIELGVGKRPLVSGEWNTSLAIDGAPLAMNESWECVCWQSDNDCDYLELEMVPAPGVVLQRSLLLAHADSFAWLADSITTGRQGKLDYHIELPLAADCECRGAEETTEFLLGGESRPSARVMPLSLPEWRSECRGGGMEHANGRLSLRHIAPAWGMYAGIFIDLDSRRLSRPFTWRRLTIAENRRILPPDLAVAQRVQCGRKHWIFYRSIGARGNRTFLGVNVSSELLAARLESDGEYEILVEVE